MDAERPDIVAGQRSGELEERLKRDPARDGRPITVGGESNAIAMTRELLSGRKGDSDRHDLGLQ